MSLEALYITSIKDKLGSSFSSSMADLRGGGATRGSCPSLTDLKQVWHLFFWNLFTPVEEL